MNILVTGALGFVGSNLIPHLVNKNNKVFGIDNLSNMSINAEHRIKSSINKLSDFESSNVDIRDPHILYNFMSYKNIDAVIHLAATGSVPRSFKNPYLTISTNDAGFVNVLQAMGSLKIKKLVYASSSSVYGDHPRSLRVEGYEGKALSPYALSKQMNESFANIYCPTFDINHVGLRFFNIYGPGQLINSEYSAVIPRFINNENITIYGDGKQTRDYTFVGDVCTAITCALDYTEKGLNGVFNVGFGIGTTVNELASLLGKQEILRSDARHGDVVGSIAETSHARESLKFNAKVPLIEGLKITTAYYDSL